MKIDKCASGYYTKRPLIHAIRLFSGFGAIFCAFMPVFNGCNDSGPDKILFVSEGDGNDEIYIRRQT